MRSIMAAIYEENHHSQTVEFFMRIIMIDYLCMMIVVGRTEENGILSLLLTSMNIVHAKYLPVYAYMATKEGAYPKDESC